MHPGWPLESQWTWHSVYQLPSVVLSSAGLCIFLQLFARKGVDSTGSHAVVSHSATSEALSSAAWQTTSLTHRALKWQWDESYYVTGPILGPIWPSCQCSRLPSKRSKASICASQGSYKSQSGWGGWLVIYCSRLPNTSKQLLWKHFIQVNK